MQKLGLGVRDIRLGPSGKSDLGKRRSMAYLYKAEETDKGDRTWRLIFGG